MVVKTGDKDTLSRSVIFFLLAFDVRRTKVNDKEWGRQVKKAHRSIAVFLCRYQFKCPPTRRSRFEFFSSTNIHSPKQNRKQLHTISNWCGKADLMTISLWFPSLHPVFSVFFRFYLSSCKLFRFLTCSKFKKRRRKFFLRHKLFSSFSHVFAFYHSSPSTKRILKFPRKSFYIPFDLRFKLLFAMARFLLCEAGTFFSLFRLHLQNRLSLLLSFAFVFFFLFRTIVRPWKWWKRNMTD